ncbi:MAG: sodium:solute symporter [Desulfuromonas sp.]|nr:MAG: sodium:solute symporter [Desulfuromonas sp.]
MSTVEPIFLSVFILTLVAMMVVAFSGHGRMGGGVQFSLGGRRSGAWHVSGAIIGTLVGGASTIGTAQLAFIYGLSAWWFTLGAGLACLFLGSFLAIPLRRTQLETIPQFIQQHYGARARVAASLFSASGMFIQIVAQLLACGAILAALFGLSLSWSALLACGLVLVFSYGGMRGASRLGLMKLLLIYLTMVIAGVIAYRSGGGWSGFRSVFPAEPWFNLFGYGVQQGTSDLVSMLVGVISTQTYLQAIFSARDVTTARRGALLSAVLIPPLGVLGIVVGLFMRQQFPDIHSALALPEFILHYFPPALAGLAFATLLIAAVATAAGLSLGVATTLRVDLLGSRTFLNYSDLLQRRVLILLIVCGAFVLLLFNLGSAIMAWSFLSMGLRGATLFLPVLMAVLLPRRVTGRAGMWAILLAPSCVIVTGVLDVGGLSPLYWGLGCSALILVAGAMKKGH